MPPLSGRTIALLESRMSDELAAMVVRLGGTPVSAPAVKEVPHLHEAAEQVTALLAGRYRAVIFLTGAGVSAVLREAEKQGQLTPLREALTAVTVAARGPKPLAVLKRHGIPVRVTTVKPHTSRELLAALADVPFGGTPTLLVHYGERNAELSTALRARGARLAEACPYEWALPDDPHPLAALVRDVLEMRIDAILVTSQVQGRHLFQVAREMRLAHELAAALNRTVIVGAVGPVCASALKEYGVTVDVMPAAPNMASLITAVSDYFSLTGRGDTPGLA